MTSQKRLLTSSLGALLGAGMLVAAPAAFAWQSYLFEFGFVYPNSLSDENAQCALCHNSYNAGTGYNPYGSDFRFATGWTTLEQRFRAVENLNSDESTDGTANLTEINCNAQPGWTVGDTPPAGVTGLLDCDIPPEGPEIDVVPTTVDFGGVVVGDFATAEVSIYNLGDQTLTVDTLTLAGDPVFAFGINSPPPPFDIAPGARENVGIRFTPLDEVTYNGSLTIGSNDADEPEVVVSLTGSGLPPGACAPSIVPTTVNFGNVEVGASVEATIAFTNLGDGFCDVSSLIRPLNQTVFALCSPADFTVLGGETENVCVSFTPAEQILYEGLVEFSYTGPEGIVETSNVRLTGSGSPFLGSYDIYSYRATPRVRLDSLRPVTHRISIRNVGTTDGVGLLTVVGVQNGVEVFRQFLEVSDPIGGGVTTYNLQSYFPTDLGTIEWTATLESADGVDAVTATTLVQ